MGRDSDIPVIVRMRVECARCGHAEDDTYEFDMPFAKYRPWRRTSPASVRSAAQLWLDVTIGSCPRLRRRESALPCNAVVHHLAFYAPGLNVLALTDTVRFRQLERARFTPFVPGELTRTRERSVVRGRKV